MRRVNNEKEIKQLMFGKKNSKKTKRDDVGLIQQQRRRKIKTKKIIKVAKRRRRRRREAMIRVINAAFCNRQVLRVLKGDLELTENVPLILIKSRSIKSQCPLWFFETKYDYIVPIRFFV
ncbi:hypothetical protein CEXT_377951 [Caerostris extrusa]|uniref:Ribosomal protein S14 n=1 Tax=Caerostris extrusa TaxID=172846 RepID=A0AAV4WUB8_CAEEX|nr:hypothetical protein CEXT_377951 [Caerostris extrusa]